MNAFVLGAADVPPAVADAQERLLPQLWSKARIASRQLTLPPGAELQSVDPLFGEVLNCLTVAFAVNCRWTEIWASSWSDGLTIETPVLSNDLSRWGLSFTAALSKALEHLRARTKRGPPAERRWEHHPTGCGESCLLG
ncbi:Hypothetical protein SCF082_LOCUS2544 [Durusdinium trenchii]|uniref:Uncharacterized protein n=1 Tax=Durusdinium trenchii TaxID=1381693 RepID=A0ABP0HN59_9DINO